MDPELQRYFQLERRLHQLLERDPEKLTKPELQEYDKVERELQQLRAKLSEFEPPTDAAARQDDDPYDRRDGLREAAPAELRSDKSWKALCRSVGVPMDSDGWQSNAAFFQAVADQRGHSHLKRAQSEGSDSLGGYSVPSPMAAEIFDAALEGEIVRPLARVFPMRSSTLKLPAWYDVNRSTDGLYGGIAAQWSDEGGTLNVQTAEMRAVNFNAKKLAFLGRVSTELAEDSPVFAAEFQAALSRSASFHLDDAFINGDGAGKPLGILNAACTIEVAKESSGNVGVVLFENISKMWARLLPGSHQRAVWIASPSVLPSLLGLMITGTNSDSHVPVLNESNGTYRMLGRPLLISEKCPAVGTPGDLILADLSLYGIGLRAEVSLLVSPHIYMATDQLGFRLRLRADGNPLLNSAITPKNGGATLSSFVTIADRTS